MHILRSFLRIESSESGVQEPACLINSIDASDAGGPCQVATSDTLPAGIVTVLLDSRNTP